jgi:hypothetical protein
MTANTRAVQSEAIARHSIARLSDAKLAEAWMATNEQPMTVELPIVRGWLMDELETRMGRMETWADLLLAPDFDGGRFDGWLEAESGGYVNPLPYLT